MNFAGNSGESEPWKSFWIFVYMRTAESTTSDSLNYLEQYTACSASFIDGSILESASKYDIQSAEYSTVIY